jgi:hypothetical protein
MFNISCIVVPKKYRKKLKKKFTYKLNYLLPKKRVAVLLKWLSLYTAEIKKKELSSRFFEVLMSIVFNYKNTYLYKRKIYIYK